MNRWAVRVLGILMLLVFGFIFLMMYNQLAQKQQTHQKPAATQTP